MSYQVTLSNGAVLVNIGDNTLDTSTSLTLVGKNFLNYGTQIADNFVRLLETGANATPPAHPLVGQLWYNTASAVINLWTGSAWRALITGVSSVATLTGSISLAQLVTAGLAPTLSPALSGLPTAPTAPVGTNTTQIASTAFVLNQVAALSTGVISVTGASGVVTLTNLVNGGVAPLGSPNLTGIPTAPTAPVNTATNQIASTAFVQNQIAAISSGVISVLGNTGVVTLTQMTNGGLSPIASPSFSGIPKAVTAAPGTSTNQLATTAFVTNAIAAIPSSPVPPKTRIPAPLDLYVATNGNDANDGKTISTAFRTLQKAWNVILYNYDLNGYLVTVHVADGTYGGVICSGSPTGASLFADLAGTGSFGSSYGGPAPVKFQSASGNAANCIINTTNQSCFLASFGAQIDVDTITLQASGGASSGNTNGSALVAQYNGYLGAYNCNFGPCGNSHLEAYTGVIGLGPNNTITGGAVNFMNATRKGLINAVLATVNVVGSPAFTTFALSEHASFIEADGLTFSNAGGVTGVRSVCQYGGMIATYGGNANNFFPGNVSGVVDASTYGLFF